LGSEGVSREAKPLTQVIGTKFFGNAKAFSVGGAMYKSFFCICELWLV